MSLLLSQVILGRCLLIGNTSGSRGHMPQYTISIMLTVICPKFVHLPDTGTTSTQHRCAQTSTAWILPSCILVWASAHLSGHVHADTARTENFRGDFFGRLNPFWLGKFSQVALQRCNVNFLARFLGWILEGEFLDGEFLRGPLFLEKIGPKNSTQEFGSEIRASKIRLAEFGPKIRVSEAQSPLCRNLSLREIPRKTFGRKIRAPKTHISGHSSAAMTQSEQPTPTVNCPKPCCSRLALRIF